MKKIILIIFLVGITFLGCNDNLDNTIVTPPTETDDFSSSLTRPIIITNWLYASKLIDGSIGAEFKFDTTYVNTEGRVINVYARLKINPGSFNGTTLITMIPNPEDLSIKFFPEMEFNEVVRITYRITGLDLEAYGYTETGTVDFAFYADDGSTKLIKSDKSHVNLEENEIKVMNAQLYHFSRYGWLR